MTEPTSSDSLGKGMPTYLVLDISQSMTRHQTVLNDMLAEILLTLYKNPRISEFVHLSIITFNAQPHVVLKMTELTKLRRRPELNCRGTTNFAPMFELLRDRIEIDIPLLQTRGYSVLRPVVLLLTDGAPSDRDNAWEKPHRALIDKEWARHPRIIGFGFGDAVEEILRRMAPFHTYMADPARGSEAEALSEAMSGMLNTMVASAKARELRLPHEIAGFYSAPEEYVEG
jgi:uncharacterized protein YegL